MRYINPLFYYYFVRLREETPRFSRKKNLMEILIKVLSALSLRCRKDHKTTKNKLPLLLEVGCLCNVGVKVEPDGFRVTPLAADDEEETVKPTASNLNRMVMSNLHEVIILSYISSLKYIYMFTVKNLVHSPHPPANVSWPALYIKTW